MMHHNELEDGWEHYIPPANQLKQVHFWGPRNDNWANETSDHTYSITHRHDTFSEFVAVLKGCSAISLTLDRRRKAVLRERVEGNQRLEDAVAVKHRVLPFCRAMRRFLAPGMRRDKRSLIVPRPPENFTGYGETLNDTFHEVKGFDIPGGDLLGYPIRTEGFESCSLLCLCWEEGKGWDGGQLDRRKFCQAYTFVSTSAECWLKNEVDLKKAGRTNHKSNESPIITGMLRAVLPPGWQVPHAAGHHPGL
mmetsp:Transcript_7627/g.12102  ORF Transcript_7627/g.12102 Transcript_7627/m.12102 type:complete len:250 (-) Transcript_7627:333-1082(-)